MSWGDFLGYGVGNPPGTLVQFEEARELVRGIGLESQEVREPSPEQSRKKRSGD